jgi:hypothetical protein
MEPTLPARRAGKHFDRVLIIVLENQNYTSTMKDKFLMDLAAQGCSFSNFRNLYHPSAFGRNDERDIDSSYV